MNYYIEKVHEYIKNPSRIKYYLLNHGLGGFLPDKLYLSILFKMKIGYSINWNEPRGFNEKLQWLKIHEQYDDRTQLVDKYAVREYIKRTIGEEYLVPLLGRWDSFDAISFDELPDQFVLKCTHDSGGVVICTNKEAFDYTTAKRIINHSLKKNFYKSGREYPYKNIRPMIIAEKYLEDESGFELKDYKLMCFNGKVKCSFVCSKRNSEFGLCVNFYDKNWKPMPFERHYHKNPEEIPKPHNYEEMVALAEILACNMKFVRVDFYNINGKIYFGELTFYPGSGMEEFTPEKYDYLLGSWLDLS